MTVQPLLRRAATATGMRCDLRCDGPLRLYAEVRRLCGRIIVTVLETRRLINIFKERSEKSMRNQNSMCAPRARCGVALNSSVMFKTLEDLAFVRWR